MTLPKTIQGSVPILRRLLGESLRRYWRSYAISVVLMIIVAATTAGSAYLMKNIINDIFLAKNAHMVYIIATIVATIFIIKGAATYFLNVIMARVGNRIVADHQKRMFRHILRQNGGFFDTFRFGDLMTRLNSNARSVRQVIEMVAVSFGRDLLTLIGLLAVIVSQSASMSLVAMVVAVPAILGVAYLVKRVRSVARAEVLSMGRIVSVLKETVLGSHIVKAFGMEPEMDRRMSEAVGDVERRANKIVSLSATTGPMMETVAGLAIAVVIIWGGNAVIHHGQDAGSFFSFITALLLAYDPARRLARMHVHLEAGIEGVRMMYEVLDAPVMVTEAANTTALAVERGEVRFQGVSFSYRDVEVALDNLNFTAVAGQTTALVGPSGAGKSTVLGLIERFYDPQSGQVYIDGQDIRDVSLTSLRSQIALVTQDTFLFDGSVMENIRIGRPASSQAEIIDAAKSANAHAFITALPEGYQTQIGEDGSTLSGGQRQRLAIARAMLRQAPILLLDEATSALDAESETKIQSALAQLMQGKTAIIIAHRLSTIRNADKLIVMDQGRVIEEGTHDELIAQGGLYKRLHDLQFGDTNADNASAGFMV